MTPIEMLIDEIEFKETGNTPDGSGLPYATHEGVLEIFGTSIRCYRLNDGRAIFHADDIGKFFGMDLEK